MAGLEGKTILISGAAGTVGRAVADAVGKAGGKAVRSDLSTQKGIAHSLDVTSEAAWQKVLGGIERLDGLVNAAGIAIIGDVEQIDYPAWQKVLAVNLDGTFLGCKYAMPLLRKQGGAIVNISSVSGIIGGHNLAAYNASKGGVRLLTKSVALHGARLKPPVRCNSVHPAFLEGPMVEAFIAETTDPAKARSRMTRDIPIGRFGKADEIAALCVYLLSDDAAFVTGAEYVIDGGLTAR